MFMNVDRVEIEEVVRDYFQGYLSAQAALVAKAFHPETRLLSVEGGKLERTEMPEWLENLENRLREGDVRTADPEVVSIDVTDSAAVAKVRLTFPQYRLTDYLSLLKIESHWRIVGKIYAVQE